MEEQNNIINKLDDLVKIIKNQESYKKYIEYSTYLKNDKKIMSLIEEIKSLEQHLINMEYEKQSVEHIKKELDEKNNELKSYPTYLEYSYIKEDLNNQFQQIKSIIENEINKYTN